ncbi:MAG: hypothetical protein KZQ85_16010 [Candidatus Thiodiazotropha sp. (ex Myrtea sp. 'scaly one' KF741663)]|nr:hypothetical protein [Candidatus Thiodiazotropha sp. (ex Myrtea sp. 'scaly one' KF741663)]
MGLFDFLFSKKTKKRMVAEEIGLESGLFVMCPVCHDVTEAENPSAFRPATESLVRQLIQKGDSRLDLFEHDPVAAIETISQVGRDLPFRCNCHRI